MLITGDERRTVSLLTALISLIILFAVLYVIFRLIVRVFSAPKYFSKWSEKRREVKDVALLEKGWIELLEGRTDKAEKNLLRLIDNTKDDNRQILASMAAARAAHDLGHFEQRDKLLKEARILSKDNNKLQAAVATVQAELLLQQGQGVLALEHLEFVKSIDSKNTYVQQLLLSAYRQTNQTVKMFDVARQLYNKNVLSDNELNTLVEHYGTLHIAYSDFEDAQKFYNSLSRTEKAIPDIASMMATRYQYLEDYAKEGEVLEVALNQKFDNRLLAHYVKCPESEVNTRLNKAQQWLAADENNPELLIALGQLCLMVKLWGQAERYLNKSLSIQESSKAHALLGILNDKQGRPQEAMAHWRLASNTTAVLGEGVSSVLAAADTSNDPAPPDVKDSRHYDDHLLANKVETITPSSASKR